MKDKLSFLSAPLVYVILGLILILRPTATANFIFSAAGLLLLVYGGFTVARFFLQGGVSQFDLVFGLAAAVVGGLLLAHPSFLMDFIFIILGVYVLADGLVNLKRGLDLRQYGYAGWTYTLAMSGVSVLLGIFILWQQGHLAQAVLLRAIGCIFLYEGILNLVSLHAVSKFLGDNGEK